MYGAIDVGGTKTLIAVLSDNGEIIERVKFPTPSDYTDFLKQLGEAWKQLAHNNVAAVTIAMPGSIDREHGLVHAFGNLSWRDIPVHSDVENITHAPVLLENDANLAGLSEALLVFPAYDKVLYVTVSTGIGTGIVVNGTIDPAFADSEGGDIMVQHNGELVKWESVASGRAIVARYGKRAADLEDPKAWQAISRDLAVGLLDLLAIVQPDLVIIGGGVGSHFDKFGDFLKTELKKYENPMLPIPPVQQAQHAEEAVIYGCYELAKKHFSK